jgi:signal transduction histidine kinase
VSNSSTLFWTYIAAALAVIVILAALGAAIVIYQRRFLAMHREYANKLLAAHEEERAYVAREVHDDALQRVALIQHELAEWDMAETRAAGGAQRASALKGELEDLSFMLRRVAHRLHPAIIEQGGLVPALSQLGDDTARMTGMSVEVSAADTLPKPLLDRDRALNVFRVAQEALRNTTRHAKAKTVAIHVTNTPGDLVLTIADNGQGFDAELDRTSNGLGMISMRERARLLGGRIDILSQPGHGTTVRLTVPFNKT